MIEREELKIWKDKYLIKVINRITKINVIDWLLKKKNN